MKKKKNPFVLICGPCVLESMQMAIEIGQTVKNLCEGLGWQYIFKASYDKANRTSLSSYRGPGSLQGLKMLGMIRKKLGVPVLTDVHTVQEVKAAKEIDILQIPAFLCRQTDLIVAAAKSDKPINVKKGQFVSPMEVNSIADKLKKSGCKKYWITERGTTFGYQNLIVDMRSLVWMRENGHKVIFDATHSVQRPGGHGDSSSGEGYLAPYLARAATAVGIDGLFIETHPNPSKSPSDGDNMIPLAELPKFLRQLSDVQRLAASWE
jgi:2-dehydro-3-deoxyphosphooctonate aldolase (KDO 8-P synthase)